MKKIYTLLPALVIALQVNAQSLYFPPLTQNTWDTISPQSLNWCQSKIDSLYSFLDSGNTKAFILLKDGKIVLEKYFGTHTQSTPWQWASAGKTITSFMVGIAQQENFLSIADTSSEYLAKGWTSCTPQQEEKITIRHQLTMTSGLDDGVADPYCTMDTCLTYLADAGTRWAYHNGPYTKLDSVIEVATGRPLNVYTTQKLKNPTGMTGLFVPVGFNNVFFSNARSMARFGLLILNKGNWDGNPVMTDTSYFNQMVNTSQTLNESYGYLWWLNGKQSYKVPGLQFNFPGPLFPNAPADVFAAMGKDGQFLNVAPGENMVWLRMGNSPNGLPVPYLLNDEIWAYINELECAPLGIDAPTAGNSSFHLFPNPTHDELTIESEEPVAKVEIFNMQGQLIKTVNNPQQDLRIGMSDWLAGLYIVKVDFGNGRVWMGRVVKENN